MVEGEVFHHREAFTIELALKKTSYSFYATMTKGIMCNWLVCMAVWQGNAAQDVTGKLLGIWFPISAFVTSGCVCCALQGTGAVCACAVSRRLSGCCLGWAARCACRAPDVSGRRLSAACACVVSQPSHHFTQNPRCLFSQPSLPPFCRYEHSIANMFVIPLAMRLGAPISVHTFVVKNLIPATIGNLIGGAIFVAMAMGLSYGSWEKQINAAGARLYHRVGVLPDCGLAAFGAANAAPAKPRDSNASADASQQSAVSSGDVAAQLAVVTPLKSVAAHPAAV